MLTAGLFKTATAAAVGIACTFLMCSNTRKADNNTPKESPAKENHAYMKDGYMRFDPDIVEVKGAVKWIFPVPEPNAVGTIDLDNAITFIKFRDGKTKPEYKVIAKNFSKTVSGNFDYRFSPNFADDMLVYSKTRVAVICDLKTGEAFHAGFKLTSDDYMLGIRFLDPQKKLFIVVKAIESGKGIRDPWIDNLHLATLDGKRLVDLGAVIPHFKERPSIPQATQSYNNWIIHDRKLIACYYERSRKKMLCFDGLKEATHPFVEIFNRNIDTSRSLRDMAIHPELPFGVIVEEPDTDEDEMLDASDTHDLLLIRWDTNDPDKQFTAIHQKLILLLCPRFNIKVEYFACAYTGFSPDGKWFVMGIFSYNAFRNPYFIAIPVDKKYPDFLGMDELVVLNSGERITYTAWATNPTAFVVANGSSELKKWDLENLHKARVVGDTAGAK